MYPAPHVAAVILPCPVHVTTVLAVLPSRRPPLPTACLLSTLRMPTRSSTSWNVHHVFRFEPSLVIVRVVLQAAFMIPVALGWSRAILTWWGVVDRADRSPLRRGVRVMLLVVNRERNPPDPAPEVGRCAERANTGTVRAVSYLQSGQPTRDQATQKGGRGGGAACIVIYRYIVSVVNVLSHAFNLQQHYNTTRTPVGLICVS